MALDEAPGLSLRHSQLIECLEVEPQFRGSTEIARQPQGSVSGYAAPAADDFAETRGSDAELLGEGIDTHAERNDVLLLDRFARMWGLHGHCVAPLMVVDNFNVDRLADLPHEADPILIVDPDAVLAGTIAFESLQLEARAFEVLERAG